MFLVETKILVETKSGDHFILKCQYLFITQ